jgi:protease PrsW
MVTVYRNNQTFGPYPFDALKKYVEEGKILLTDKASVNSTSMSIVKDILKTNNISVFIKNNGNVASQIKSLGKELILPKWSFIKNDLFHDDKLIYLAVIGLAPAFLIRFTFASYLTFYAIALYFSVLWAVFFYNIFKTDQVVRKKTIAIFFLSQVTALVMVYLQVFPPFSWLYGLIESKSILARYIGFVFGVGVLEEFIKAVPLFYLIKTTKEPLIPQTLVYYGLMSGIGFGVLEGVHYQTNANTTLEYDAAFFMNIARLTTLPFLHAVWCGIAGYFISFANLYPLYRRGLYVLALFIPAFLHGSYDVFGWSLIGLAFTVFSVLLLVFYLKRCKDYQSKFINL